MQKRMRAGMGVAMLGWALTLAAVMTVPTQAAVYYVNQPLDHVPSQATIGNADAVSTIPGRLRDQQGLLIDNTTVAFDLPAIDSDAWFIEFWVKHHDWDALTDQDVVLLTLGHGQQTLTLRKPAEQSTLELLIGDRVVQSHAIYHWTHQDWMTRQDKDLWHYVNLGLVGGRPALTVDGFPARVVDEQAVVTGKPGVLGLHGTPATGYAMLHVIGDQPPTGERLRERYRAMYRGKLALKPNTITVPHIAGPPNVDGRIDDPQWSAAARVPMLTSLRNPQGMLISEAVTVHLAYDDQRFYMAFDTPYQGTLDATHWNEKDRPLWGEESYEIFLLPPWTGTPDYKQLVGNPYGDQTDLHVFDRTWEGRWDWVTHRSPGRWTAEFQATFAGIDTPHPGELDIWNINILNTRANAAFSWALAYHDIGSFGVLRFERNAPVLRPDRYEISSDTIVAPVEILGGLAARELTVTLELYAGDGILPVAVDTQQVTADPGHTHQLRLAVDRGGLEQGKLILNIRDDAGVDLYYYAVDFPHAPVSERAPRQISTAPVEESPKSFEDMTDQERAYARTWTAEQLGETLLSMMQWQNNTIGLTDQVPAPWTPMQVQDQTVVTWGQRYEYRDSILPVQITSQGQALLAAPPYFVLTVDGRTIRFEDAAVELEKISDSLVRVRTRATAGPYELQVQADYEFDGMARVEAALSSPDGAEPVDGFHLVWPLKRERSTLYHWATPHSGHPPYSDSGAVADSGIELDLFRELVWLGDEWMGLTWFAESVKNYQIQDEQGIQVVSPPAGDRRDLTIKFADRRFVLDTPWELLFGLQATPTRPRAANVRHLSDAAAMRFPWRWGDGEYYIWQSDQVEAARQNIRETYESGRWLMPVSSTHFYGQFRYWANPFGPLSNPGMMHREVMLWGPLWARTRLSPGLPVIPRRHTAVGNWYGRALQPTESTGGRLVRMCPASPFQDFYLHQLKQLVDATGLSAIYLDQPMSACSNPHHDCGFIDYKGDWRARYPVFAERRMLRRIRQVLVDGGIHDQPLIRWHSSNHVLVPLLSLADVFWDGENYLYGPLRVHEFYSRVLPEARMRAQHTGLQFGFGADLLPELAKNQDDRYAPSPASVRDMMGLFLVHDSTVYPLWTMHNRLVRFLLDQRQAFPLDQMEVIYYWQDDSRVRVDDPDVRFIVHHNRDQALLILFNWSDRPVEVPVHLDLAGLGLEAAGARDVVTGQVLGSQGEAMTVSLLPRDLRMVVIDRQD